MEKGMRELEIKSLLSNMFSVQEYSPSVALNHLMDYGGISRLMNDLGTSHRNGLSTYKEEELKERANVYGRNEQLPGQSLLKKSILNERDFMMNLLFYLLTLRVCIKLLLLRDISMGLDPLHGQPFHLDLQDELFSYGLLLVIMFLKAMVSVEYFHLDKDERKYKNGRVTIKRDGEFVDGMESELLVGDILLVESSSTVRVDGIILSCENLVVSETLTILSQDSKKKTSIWNYDSTQKDPFILAGSQVISGKAEMLILTVGQDCTFRIQPHHLHDIEHESPSMTHLKYMMENIQFMAKLVCLILGSVLTIKYLYNKTEPLLWTDFIYVLQIYSSLIGFYCFLQRLKILKSLQFFMQDNASGKYYRIHNQGTFEKMGKLDVLFVELSTISIRSSTVRETEYFHLDKLGELSVLNTMFQVKIVTSGKSAKVKELFGVEAEKRMFSPRAEHVSSARHIEMLDGATFLVSCSGMEFVDQYLPIFRALDYEIGYVSNMSSTDIPSLPPDILHISFHKLHKDLPANPQNGWIKIQNKLVMQDVLWQITAKSFMFGKLFNTYVCLLVNNVIIFVMMCMASLLDNFTLNLYWSLLIIIVNRYTFFTIYRSIVMEAEGGVTKPSIWQMMPFNVYVLPYYLYVLGEISEKNSLFVFMLANSMFRVETLLFKHARINPKLLLSKLVIFLTIWWVDVLLNAQTSLVQQVENIGGLFCIFIGYVILL